jgi:uncharacterized membrane protein
MSEPISHTAHGDAPLSSARKPDPRATLDTTAHKGDELIGRTVTINRPRQALYAFWRDFRNLPLFMENIQSVSVMDEQRSHWVVRAPADRTVEWDAVITEDVPGEAIAWASTKEAGVRNSGRIEFRDSTNGRGTEVTATIIYDPPAGGVGKAIAKLFQREPKIQARQDLRRFKQLMETGEIATAQPPDAAPRAQ